MKPLTEADMFDAMRLPVRQRQRCACRGWIEADPADSTDIEASVMEHQQSDRHRDWRWLNGIETLIRRVE